MAFEQTTRNRLQKFVLEARDLLKKEFIRQMQHDFGMDPENGKNSDIEKLVHLDDARQETARMLRDTFAHYMAAQPFGGEKGTLDRIVREQAFTVLNRLCAVRMAEARGFLIESVANGYQSKGFQLYARLAGHGLGEMGEAYQSYLFSLFDEFAVDLPVLFDRYSAMGRLFPKDTALRELLDLINAPDIVHLWAEDETIGWIYQYFNSKEERRQMRDASQAPRNSRELAVRNQFFTPRYVVEFLTDNTLGRIWYEMTQGNTALAEDCQYLVRRPDEVFLSVDQGPVLDWFQGNEQETEPQISNIARSVNGYLRTGRLHEGAQEWLEQQMEAIKNNQAESFSTQTILDILFVIHQRERFCEGMIEKYQKEIETLTAILRQRVEEIQKEDLSQEALLNLPVFIPLRSMKDPRNIKILDPACGSGHFLLYAFDLLETIYKEYWDLEDQYEYTREKSSNGLLPLKEVYKTKDALIADLPRLVIEYNLHCIDIDPRAVQIAGLSLWLRSQRGWQEQGIKPKDRPAIQKSNIVCAEPMPGEADMLQEFADSLKPKVLGQLVEIIFEKMELAGEAGPLLKIEEEIADAVDKAREEFNKELLRRKEEEEDGYLPGMAPKKRQMSLFDFSDLPDKTRFWEMAEDKILGALKDYAEQLENGSNSRRRLFANDAAKGFAFIDLCQKRYDVVLMNPPFGAYTFETHSLLSGKYQDCNKDFYPSFVQRFAKKTIFLGAITNRTGLFLKRLAEWRKSVFLKETYLSFLVDMGLGVLDALVETAMYITQRQKIGIPHCFDLLSVPERIIKQQLQNCCIDITNGIHNEKQYISNLNSFLSLPSHPIAYNVSQEIVSVFTNNKKMESDGLIFRVTSPQADDFRFLRLFWEVAPASIGEKKFWSPISKGGDYQPYIGDFDLLVNWDNSRQTFRGFLGTSHRPLTKPACADLFFKGGITWSERTASRFSPRILPKGMIFSSVGPFCGGLPEKDMLITLGIMMTSSFQSFLELFLSAGDATSSGSAARHYQVGTLRSLPAPELLENDKVGIINNVNKIIEILLDRLKYNELSMQFESYPCFWEAKIKQSIHETDYLLSKKYVDDCYKILHATHTNDQILFKSYGLTKKRSIFIEKLFGKHPIEYKSNNSSEDISALFNKNTDDLINDAINAGKFGRNITVKSYYADRHLEVITHLTETAPKFLKDVFFQKKIKGSFVYDLSISLLSYLLGNVFGRWNIKYSTGEKVKNDSLNYFAPLPACPPGMLQNSEGLPAEPKDVAADYPLRITWNGIIIDDEGHPEDIIARVREAIEVIWKDKAEDIEQEAVEILGINSLREYFSKPTKFFADHLKRYSKSRRQAPIYWPLSTASGSYALWLYYHRLTDQTLYTCVNDYVELKIKEAANNVNELQAKSKRKRQEEKQLEDLSDFKQELIDFRDELLRVAKFWKPDLNDGVQITAAPLWQLFRHRPWQKKLKDAWQKLGKGDYDWAHLAFSIWPERVVKAAQKDRSIAIAHDLEEDLWEEVEVSRDRRGNPKYQWQPRDLSHKEVVSVIQSASSDN